MLEDYARNIREQTGYVFAARTGDPLIIDRPWKRAMQRAGLKDFRFHDLCHTAEEQFAGEFRQNLK